MFKQKRSQFALGVDTHTTKTFFREFIEELV